MIEYNGMKLIKVEWVDSASSNNWISAKAEENEFVPVHIVTFGILFKDKPEYIVIIQNFNDELEHVSNFISIPRRCITKIDEL